MDVLYFLKLIRPTSLNTKDGNPESDFPKNQPSAAPNDYVLEQDEEEEEDSFFELELTVPVDVNGGEPKTKIEQPKFPQPSLSPADGPLFSKRKILPIEQPISISGSPKPNQSPVSVLKSAPRFRILAFKKSKSLPVRKTGEEEKGSDSDEKGFFTVRLSRNSSLRKQISDDAASEDGETASSRRFPKEIVQRYLKLINPLYVKVASSSKRGECDKVKFTGEFASYSAATTPTSSPAASGSPKKEKQGNGGNSIQAGLREVRKHLRKSKSASSSSGTGAASSTAAAAGQRRDDSLLLQADGIQSAILHCKRSFNSSRDSSLLSRFASEPLPQRVSVDSPRVSNDEFGWN